MPLAHLMTQRAVSALIGLQFPHFQFVAAGTHIAEHLHPGSLNGSNAERNPPALPVMPVQSNRTQEPQQKANDTEYNSNSIPQSAGAARKVSDKKEEERNQINESCRLQHLVGRRFHRNCISSHGPNRIFSLDHHQWEALPAQRSRPHIWNSRVRRPTGAEPKPQPGRLPESVSLLPSVS